MTANNLSLVIVEIALRNIMYSALVRTELLHHQNVTLVTIISVQNKELFKLYCISLSHDIV